jgi:KDO2-lipid IV(A) lauroyltransferase
MSRFKTIRHWGEYVLLRAVLALVARLTPATASRVAARAAAVLHPFTGSRRRVAESNLLLSGIAADAAAARRLARASARHFAMAMVESLKAPAFFADRPWQAYIELQAHPRALALLRDPCQGVIVVSAHLGYWEIGAYLLATLKPALVAVRPMNNPLTDRLISERTHRSRMETVPARGAAAPRLIRAVRAGMALDLLMDQHARHGGMLIPFFGKPASTHTSPARFHLMTGAPILMVTCVRTGVLRGRMDVAAPLVHAPTDNREADVRTILTALTAQLESAIRGHPDQYLWAHRRWR